MPQDDTRTEWGIVSDIELEEGDGLANPPQFELEFLFDDDEEPEEVTIFSDKPEKLSTQWITVDIDNAIDVLKCL